MRIGQYAKSIVMVLAAGLAIFSAANTDGVVTPSEFVNIAIAVLTAIGVYLIPNLDEGVRKYAKTIVAFVGAAASALALVVANATGFSEVTQSEWLGVLLAALAAVGLYIIPNTSAAPEVTVVNSDIKSVRIHDAAESDISVAKVVREELARHALSNSTK